MLALKFRDTSLQIGPSHFTLLRIRLPFWDPEATGEVALRIREDSCLSPRKLSVWFPFVHTGPRWPCLHAA